MVYKPLCLISGILLLLKSMQSTICTIFPFQGRRVVLTKHQPIPQPHRETDNLSCSSTTKGNLESPINLSQSAQREPMDAQGENANSTQISKENDFFVVKELNGLSSHSSTLLSSPNQCGV